jgi:hypothetical protein
MDYKKIYDQIIDRSKCRKIEGYTEKHHIIPKCMGGNNSIENLAILTAREHFLCHLILVEIYPTIPKLKQALWVMVNGRNRLYLPPYTTSNRMYEYCRNEFIKTKKGIPLTQLIKNKISENRKGIYHSTKTKDKISKSLMGRNITWGDKISSGKKGIPRNITWGDEISKAKMGKPKKGKTILQICPQTQNIIKEYPSTSAAIIEHNNKNIPYAIKIPNKICEGFLWQRK